MTQSSKAAFTGYQVFLITLLALLQFSIVLDFMIIAPLGEILMRTLNIKPAQFSLVVSSYAFSAAIAGVLAAGFADKFDRKQLLLFFHGGFIIGSFLCGIANTYWMLLAARIVTGLFGGVIASVSLAIVTDTFAPKQRGRTMAFIQMAFAASQILGIPLGIILAENFGWHSAFFMIVILAVVVFLGIVFKIKPINEHLKIKSNKNPLLHLWHTITNKKYQTGFLAIAFLSIGGYMLIPFNTAFLVYNVGITQRQLPIIFMFTGIFSIFTMPIIGRLSDNFEKFKIFFIGSILAILMTIIYSRFSIVPIWQVVIVNILVMTGIMGRTIPAQSLSTMVPSQADRGSYLSITEALKQFSGGLGAVISGLIIKQTTKDGPLQYFDILGYAVAAVILISVFFVYRISINITDK